MIVGDCDDIKAGISSSVGNDVGNSMISTYGRSVVSEVDSKVGTYDFSL